MLQHSLGILAGSPVRRRIVVLGAEAERVLAEVDLLGAEHVVCEDWECGQARSLAAGLAAAGQAEAALILLGDQPLVSVAAVERVLAARRPGAVAVRATYGAVPGHPVVLEAALFADAIALEGDAGARVLFEGPGSEVLEVPCEDVASGLDVDTVDALREVERVLEGR